MIRNPYAKRPRPATPEISCQGPSISISQGHIVVAPHQHATIEISSVGRNNTAFNALKQQQQEQQSNSFVTDPLLQQRNDSNQIPALQNTVVPSQMLGSHQQNQMLSTTGNHGSTDKDPWDTCDIDWGAASQQLDQAASLYQEKSQTTTTTLPLANDDSTQLAAPASELLPDTTYLERPINAVGNVTTSSVANDWNEHMSIHSRPSSSVSYTSSLQAQVAAPSLGKTLQPIAKASNNLSRPSSNSKAVIDPTLSTSKVAADAEALAALRPAAWTCTTTTAKEAANPNVDRPSSSDSQRSDVRQNALPAALQFSSHQVRPVQDEYRDALVRNANLGAPLLNNWTLFPHQRKAILRALLMRRMILALDMGLGKTLIGCVWAKAFKASFDRLKIFVTCPVSLLKEWKRTAQEATGLEVQPDASSKGATENSLDLQICSWAKVPTEVSKSVKHFVVVCDEAHHIQSMSSARTRDTLQLVGMERCVGVLLLTGTPMKNGKPCNLFPLLRAVQHPFGANQKAFEIHFCAGHQKSFGPSRVVWDANGSSNLGVLRELVASHMLYMTKDQCLEDLPPQTRTFRQVPVSSRFQLQHNQALNDLAKLYASAGNFQDNGAAILGAVQRVRMIASLAKIDATVGLATEILQDEPAVVIFTSFQKVAASVHQKLKDSGWHGELLTGETPAAKRQGMVDNFQSGLSPVFVCTFGAGGVGLTLTAACTVILLDRPWTPGDAHQAEDRVRRIGQTKPVTSVWMTAFDLDRQIDSLLEQKSKTSNTVLSDQNDENNDTRMAEAPKISIFQMLKSLLGNRQAPSSTTTSVLAGHLD